MRVLELLGLGALAGGLSGLVGIGGGVVIVPALVLLLGFSQQQAQGTTLAMLLPPIGLLAAWAYYRQGLVNVPVAAWLCAGFLLGSWIGARIAIGIPTAWLEKAFGVFLMLLSLKMIFKS
jgi:uncharacterized membrane protein YfcA